MLKNLLNPSKKIFNLTAIVILLLAGWVIYANCLGNEMFWDDDDFILKNRYIKDFSFWPLWFKENLVAGSYFVSNYWRPTLLAVFTTEWHFFKENVYGWHAVSVWWHLIDGILVYWLFARLFDNRLLSLIIALIFIIHPVHNEAVVYVNSLGDSLATFFVLLSLIAYAHFRASKKPALLSRSYYASLLLFPLAVTSKETGFVLCGLLPLMDFLLFQQSSSIKQRLIKTATVVWPLLLMAVYYVYLRGTILNFSNSFNFYNESNEFTTNIFLRLMTFFKAMTQYTGFLFIPYELRVERQMPFAHSLLEPDVLFGGLLVSLLVWGFFRNWSKKPWISFGIGWFFIAIAPASNVLVPINALIYEHFLYVPMIGITSLVVGWLATQASSLPSIKKVLWFVLGAYVIFFSVMGIKRNLDWRTAIIFYEKLSYYSPSYRVINNLGMEYADKGIHDKAEEWYLKAIAMDPKNPVAYHNIGGTYRDTGRMEQSIESFKKAIELNPNFIFSYRSLAEIYWRLGQYEEAYRYLSAVTNYDPNDKNAAMAMAELTRILKARQP